MRLIQGRPARSFSLEQTDDDDAVFARLLHLRVVIIAPIYVRAATPTVL